MADAPLPSCPGGSNGNNTGGSVIPSKRTQRYDRQLRYLLSQVNVQNIIRVFIEREREAHALNPSYFK